MVADQPKKLNQPNYLCDLHCHTQRSDGNDTYIEFIDNAASLGMKVVAITDHDITPLESLEIEGRTLSIVDYGRAKKLHVLPGIEFSCDSDVDDVHIVGLGCNWKAKEFVIVETDMKQSKAAAYRKLTEVLTGNGIKVSWEALLDNHGNPRSPYEIQRKHIFEAIAANGYASSWQEAKLLVRDNPQYNIKRDKIHPVAAIELIHQTGGIAILAHPYLIDAVIWRQSLEISRYEYIQQFLEAGLDGIEAAYPYSKTSYQGDLSDKAIEQEIIATYGHCVRIISGGSDYHNDRKKGIENSRMIGEKGVSWEYFLGNPSLKALLTDPDQNSD
jgi:predicted metal-dependent phosphoesterase TrpH